jgi:hypothetical protein
MATRFFIDSKRFERLPPGPAPPPNPLSEAGVPYVFRLLRNVETINIQSRRDCHAPIDLPGRTHVTDFALVFCSTGCGNLCEIDEPEMAITKSIPVFICRACNPVVTRRIRIQLHSFDKDLGGHAPLDGGAKTTAAYDARTSRRNAKRELRHFLDSNDQMLVDGHQVKKDRTVDRECPEWMCDRFEFLNFLITVFPKMLDESSPKYQKHRETAALWGYVMYCYHRMGLPASYVADLLSGQKERELTDGTFEILEERLVTDKQVERVVHAIKNRREGLRVDGTKLTGKRGRPKKVTAEDLNKIVEIFDS